MHIYVLNTISNWIYKGIVTLLYTPLDYLFSYVVDIYLGPSLQRWVAWAIKCAWSYLSYVLEASDYGMAHNQGFSVEDFVV